MYGHTDYGTTTLLFSVPVTALHIWTMYEKWQPVRYAPGSVVVNLGEALEIISGGHFKATRHKVCYTTDVNFAQADHKTDRSLTHRATSSIWSACPSCSSMPLQATCGWHRPLSRP